MVGPQGWEGGGLCQLPGTTRVFLRFEEVCYSVPMSVRAAQTPRLCFCEYEHTVHTRVQGGFPALALLGLCAV